MLFIINFCASCSWKQPFPSATEIGSSSNTRSSLGFVYNYERARATAHASTGCHLTSPTTTPRFVTFRVRDEIQRSKSWKNLVFYLSRLHESHNCYMPEFSLQKLWPKRTCQQILSEQKMFGSHSPQQKTKSQHRKFTRQWLRWCPKSFRTWKVNEWFRQ